MLELKCKDCSKRHIGCHSDCESYLAWKKEHDELNKKRHENAVLVGWAAEDARKYHRRK